MSGSEIELRPFCTNLGTVSGKMKRSRIYVLRGIRRDRIGTDERRVCCFSIIAKKPKAGGE